MRQASWIGAHVFVVEADGTRRRKRDGWPEVRTILFPVSSATLYDVWNVIGLKGTGTDSYSVNNLFISEEFAALRDEPSALREQGPLYRIPSMFVYAMGFAAVSLGVARATLDAFGELARGKTSFGLKPMRDNNAVQAQLGRNEGNLRAARAYLYATATEVWHDVAWVGERNERPVHRRPQDRAAAGLDLDHSPGRRAWSMPPITWPAPRRCFSPANSSAASATCTLSPSSCRAATRTMRQWGKSILGGRGECAGEQ